MSVYQCPECGFQYDEARGDPHEGLPPGTRWLSLPEDHACPGCAVRLRDDFALVGAEPSALHVAMSSLIASRADA